MKSQLPDIQNPHDFELNGTMEELIKKLFKGYDRVTLQADFSGKGFGGCWIYKVSLVRNRRFEPSVVIKIGAVFSIEKELEALVDVVEPHFSAVAAPRFSESREIIVDSDNELAILGYYFAGGDIIDYENTWEYIEANPDNAILRQITATFQAQLFPFIRKTIFINAESNFDLQVQKYYERVLPVKLLIEECDPPTIDHHFNSSYVDFERVMPGDYIELTGFQYEDFENDFRQESITLRIKYSYDTYRIRVELKKDSHLTKLVLDTPKIRGRVKSTRNSTFEKIFKDRLGDNYTPENDKLNIYENLRLPNPLKHLNPRLKSTINGRTENIHGDLNLGNILLDETKNQLRLIDFADTRTDHVLHDPLRLETEYIVRVMPLKMAHLTPQVIYRFYVNLHRAVVGHQARRTKAIRSVPPQLREIFYFLLILRENTRQGLSDINDFNEYYTCLFIYLMGALKFQNVRPMGHKLAIIGAATIQKILDNEIAETEDVAWTSYLTDQKQPFRTLYNTFYHKKLISNHAVRQARAANKTVIGNPKLLRIDPNNLYQSPDWFNPQLFGDWRAILQIDQQRIRQLLRYNIIPEVRKLHEERFGQQSAEGFRFLHDGLNKYVDARETPSLYKGAASALELAIERSGPPVDVLAQYCLGMIYLYVPGLCNLKKASQSLEEVGQNTLNNRTWQRYISRLYLLMHKTRTHTPQANVEWFACNAYVQAGIAFYLRGETNHDNFSKACEMLGRARSVYQTVETEFYWAKFNAAAGHSQVAAGTLVKIIQQEPAYAYLAGQDGDLAIDDVVQERLRQYTHKHNAWLLKRINAAQQGLSGHPAQAKIAEVQALVTQNSYYDGRRAEADWRQDHQWKLSDIQFKSPPKRFKSLYSKRVTQVTFNVNSYKLLTKHENGRLSLWNDVHQLEKPSGLRKHLSFHSLQGCAFSPDNRILATSHEPSTIYLWDTETREVMRTFRTETQPYDLVLRHNGIQLIFAGADHCAHLRNNQNVRLNGLPVTEGRSLLWYLLQMTSFLSRRAGTALWFGISKQVNRIRCSKGIRPKFRPWQSAPTRPGLRQVARMATFSFGESRMAGVSKR